MTAVFVSGSRKVSRLPAEVEQRLRNVVDKGFSIFVGDANGVDKRVQAFLAEIRYPAVTVFCSGDSFRNNLGNWPVHKVAVDPSLKGRDFYTQKDKAMAEKADYGFVIWDGVSLGSFNNIIELLEKQKKALVYFRPDKGFHQLSNTEDAHRLLARCDPARAEKLFGKTMTERSSSDQASLF